jgi:hypothetical protein
MIEHLQYLAGLDGSMTGGDWVLVIIVSNCVSWTCGAVYGYWQRRSEQR